MSGKKKNQRNWKRAREFRYKKATKSTPRHPAYIFGKSKKSFKYLISTTEPHTHGVNNVPLKHNFDPEDSRPAYLRDGYFVDFDYKFEDVGDKKFRVDKEDLATVKRLSKKRFQKK